jgi:hypothetical protein
MAYNNVSVLPGADVPVSRQKLPRSSRFCPGKKRGKFDPDRRRIFG